jgi:hypothetical protein
VEVVTFASQPISKPVSITAHTGTKLKRGVNRAKNVGVFMGCGVTSY